MRVYNVPLCCGAFILADFGNTNESTGTKAPINKKVVGIYLQDRLDDLSYQAFLIAFLNEQQNEVLGETFTKKGFKLSNVGRTTNYGYDLYMYVYSNDPENPTTRADLGLDD